MASKKYDDLFGRTIYINNGFSGETLYYKIVDCKNDILYIQKMEIIEPVEDAEDLRQMSENGLGIIGIMMI